MIDDPGNWHNLNEKLGVIGFIIGGIIGMIIFVWNWIFLKTFVRHRDLQDCYDKVIDGDITAHARIEVNIKEVKDDVIWLKNYLLEHMK